MFTNDQIPVQGTSRRFIQFESGWRTVTQVSSKSSIKIYAVLVSKFTKKRIHFIFKVQHQKAQSNKNDAKSRWWGMGFLILPPHLQAPLYTKGPPSALTSTFSNDTIRYEDTHCHGNE